MCKVLRAFLFTVVLTISTSSVSIAQQEVVTTVSLGGTIGTLVYTGVPNSQVWFPVIHVTLDNQSVAVAGGLSGFDGNGQFSLTGYNLETPSTEDGSYTIYVFMNPADTSNCIYTFVCSNATYFTTVYRTEGFWTTRKPSLWIQPVQQQVLTTITSDGSIGALIYRGVPNRFVGYVIVNVTPDNILRYGGAGTTGFDRNGQFKLSGVNLELSQRANPSVPPPDGSYTIYVYTNIDDLRNCETTLMCSNYTYFTRFYRLAGVWTTDVPVYTVTDLGTLPGGTNSQAYAISNDDVVVGVSDAASDANYNGCGFSRASKPFIWTAASGMQVLGPSPVHDTLGFPPCGGGARGINDQRAVVGFLDYGSGGGFGLFRAFIWTAANGMLLIPSSIGMASDINNSGQVVGTSGASAFRWTATGGLESLGIPAQYTGANAINSIGEVAGSAGIEACNTGPVIWNAAGQPQRLNIDAFLATLPPYKFVCSGKALGINDSGDAVGSVFVEFISGERGVFAFKWSAQNNSAQAIGELPRTTTPFSEAYGLNHAGQVVGASNGRAFLWTPDRGLQDLNTLLDGSGAGWNLFSANATNDAGQIVGYGDHNGVSRAFLLTPVPVTTPSPVLAVNPPSLNFSNVNVGTTKELAFTVQNTGGGTLTGSASTSAPFSIVGNNSFNLATNQSTDITVRFSPTSATTFNGNVSFTSNGGNASPPVTGIGATAPTQFTLTVNKTGTGSGTITSSPTGIKCGTDCDHVYAKNKIVKLAAKASKGSTFVGWSGACSGNGACSVIMNATKAVTANFNVFNLDIWYMEVNQAVQRINPDSLINEVSLVAEKDTIVRGYVRNKDPDSGLTGISGILYFSPSGQNRWKRIGKSVGGLITPVLIPQPEDTEKTLNFRIPGGFGEGEYDLKMEVHLGSQKTVLATAVTRVVFHKRKTLKILYTSVRYNGNLPTGNFSTSFSLLKGVFPLAFNPKQQWIARSSINYTAIFPKAGCGFSLGASAGLVLLERLATERLLYNLTKSPNKRVDFIVGIMPKSRLDEDVDGCSKKLFNAAFVTDDSASIEASIAHEVGHLLGLPIPPRGPEEYPRGLDGLGYPIDDGFKETSDRKHFFNFSDPLMTVTKFHHLYTNFMGLANLETSWVDELSYDLLFQNLSP